MTPKILFHVQHLLGIGHTRRGALLVRAMIEEGLMVTVLSGGEPVDVDWGSAELVQLPWARARDATFKPLVDAAGHPLDAAFHERRRLLALATLEQVRPHVLLLETYPFGRRAFRWEIDALIAAARGWRPLPAILVSIRDILVARPKADWTASVVDRVRRDIDAVLVHGDPGLVPLGASFAGADEIADRLHYTGYVAAKPAPDPGPDGAGEVLVSVGGGAVGGKLLKAALAARPLTRLAGRRWRLIAGPNLEASIYEELARGLPPGVVLERFRSDFPSLLRRCHLSLNQAGYNTILDVLQAKARALVVPFEGNGETEQALRARLMAKRGIFHVLANAALDRPELLAEALDAAAEADRPTVPPFALDGARRSAELVAGYARQAREA